MDFYTSFFYSFKRFSPLILEQILPFKRRVYQEFFKVISCVFHRNFHPSFSHKHLSYPLIYSSYRSVIVGLFLGDQSVVITKDFIFVLMRGTCVFALFRVLVGSRCLRCGLCKLVGLRCVLAGTSKGTRESKEFKCELAL